MAEKKVKKTIEVWVGTKKGAFVFRSTDRKTWKISGPEFKGWEVNHVVQDPRDPKRYYAAVNSAWFGPHIHASEDGGKTWHASETGLAVEGLGEVAGKPATLARIWHIHPGHADEPGVVYAGADPGVLFRSRDWGASWEVVDGITRHATRGKWMPGAGGMMIHSINALGKGRLIVGASACGAFRSNDAGATWEPHNQGVLADFLPDKLPEVGQCVHKLLAHPRKPENLYQQNHCGVYKGKLNGKKWTDISEGLPTRFGFALAVPAAEDETLFTIPIDSPAYRCNLEGKLSVARSRDGGKTWKLLNKGLPSHDAHVTVLREAMTSDPLSPAGVYFGTSTGTVYHTRNAGEAWHTLAANLPPVYSVTVASA